MRQRFLVLERGDQRFHRRDSDRNALVPLALHDPIVGAGSILAGLPIELHQDVDRGFAHVLVLEAEGVHERLDRGLADLAQCDRGHLADGDVFVLEREDQRLDRAGVADLAQHVDGCHAHFRPFVFQFVDQRLDGGFAKLDQRLGGGVVHVGAVVLEGVDQRENGAGVADHAERLDRRDADDLRYVLQGGDQRFDRAGVADLPQGPGGGFADENIFFRKLADQHFFGFRVPVLPLRYSGFE